MGLDAQRRPHWTRGRRVKPLATAYVVNVVVETKLEFLITSVDEIDMDRAMEMAEDWARDLNIRKRCGHVVAESVEATSSRKVLSAG